MNRDAPCEHDYQPIRRRGVVPARGKIAGLYRCKKCGDTAKIMAISPPMVHRSQPARRVRLGQKQLVLLLRIDRAGGTLMATTLNGGRTVAGSPTRQRDTLEAAGYIKVDREVMTITPQGQVALAWRAVNV